MNQHAPETQTTPGGVPSSRHARALAFLLAAAPAIVGAACLAASLIPYETVSRTLFGAAPNPNEIRSGAGTLARKFPEIVARLRFCAAGFALASLLAGLFRLRLQRWIQESLLPLPAFLRCAGGSIRRALIADGRLCAGLLAAFCILGVLLRLNFLFDPANFDEADTLLAYASRPIYFALSWYTVPNNHLLHTLLLHFTSRIFGDAEWAIRLPALFAGVALIPATYWAARSLYDKHTALIAAALVAASSPLVSYSVNGRGYTLLCLFFLLLLIVGDHLLRHDSRPAWLLWALFAALGFYTIPTMLYAAGAAALWLLLSLPGLPPPRRRALFRGLCTALVVAGIFTTLFYLPVLTVSGPAPLFANDYVLPLSPSTFLRSLPRSLLRSWAFLTSDLTPALTWMLAAALAAGLAAHRHCARHRVPVLLAAALWIGPVVCLQRVTPFPRVWLFLLPLGLIVAAAGLSLAARLLAARSQVRVSSLSAGLALFCLLAVAGATLHGPAITNRAMVPGARNLTAWMKPALTSSDAILAQLPSTAPFHYYCRRNGIRLISQPAPCDPMSAVYSSTGSFQPHWAGQGRRILAIVAEPEQSLASVLATACLVHRSGAQPLMLHDSGGLRLYQVDASVAPPRPKM